MLILACAINSGVIAIVFGVVVSQLLFHAFAILPKEITALVLGHASLLGYAVNTQANV